MTSQFPPQEVQNQCCFVASRGPYQGQQCGKPCYKVPAHDNFYGRERQGRLLPVCYAHSGKWRDARNWRELQSSAANLMAVLFIQDSAEPIATAPTVPPFDQIPQAIEISKECNVCRENVHLILLPCQHTVCHECLSKIEGKCPVCRHEIDMKLMKKI